MHFFAREGTVIAAKSQITPFADRNGRVARVLMNAELSAAGLCRMMVPLWRMVDRAQRWKWTGHEEVLQLMRATNALVPPDSARDLNLHPRSIVAPKYRYETPQATANG
jgi:hypothetical protein